MGLFILWLVIYCISNTVSITLVGERSLISGNIFTPAGMFRLVTDWRFIIAMIFAVFARVSFIMINNSLLKIPKLAGASTSITTLATLISLIFILIANYYFLSERLSVQQLVGAAIILVGISLMVK